jgi:hypothetical protein
MATGETTSAPTEVAPMPIDYTPYIVGAVVVIVILAAAYAFMKRKKPKT